MNALNCGFELVWQDGALRWESGTPFAMPRNPAVVGPEAWKAFKAKDPRNDETGKNAEGRIIQNAIVVNRPDYGMPLRAVGLEVRKDRNADGYLFGLFTIKPQRPTEIVHESKAKARKAAKRKAK